MNPTKIILDADVIIHFSKGSRLNQLPLILPNYSFSLLDVVYEELNDDYRNELSNHIHFLKKISLINFNPIGIQQKEYAELLFKNLGRGESASMIYCKYNHDVIASSNLKDISHFCSQNGIVYLTTIDLLYYGIKNKLFTVEEAYIFINEVIQKGSKLPINIDLTHYIPKYKL
jgi:hypothetical protein